MQTERQFNTKATMDAFDEIYTSFDVSVDEKYLAQSGYPFDYPTRWLNDPSMNKRIAIRRLDVTPSTHMFTLKIIAEVNESAFDSNDEPYDVPTYDFEYQTFTVTEYDNLSKVLDALCKYFEYSLNGKKGGLFYYHDMNTNELHLKFFNTKGDPVKFKFVDGTGNWSDDLKSFGQFLNQADMDECKNKLTANDEEKIFHEVWNRDRLHFHASFSTSRRKFIGKRRDFYQTLSLLYPPPTNESSFYVRFTSNGVKNILLRYCEFDIQLCFIVNYKKTSVL